MRKPSKKMFFCKGCLCFLFLSTLLVTMTASAGLNYEQEIELLKARVELLEKLALNKTRLWECHVDDAKAGKLYTIGLTETGTRGRLLAMCEEKKGLFCESNIKCKIAH